ncbi:LutC/YkgG family protein [Magnetospirillum moscoviense]|uniref:Lactate utilization protein B/C n=1 Tax=Magnetospirillum moscoviense TaxID=1437059 RepID=A0A178MJC5_9PROT|nr:lactate utilization protein [Magnetospirillum moscoviense]MBF0326881.1 lactate utilization protein [Alphaproteobacteria bacterium]OAN48776.1 lactate utilization protein B/C [Magnetospirillum moscoviense]
MSETARANILARLRAAPRQMVPDRPDWTPPTYGEGRLARFRAMLEAVHGEIHEVTTEDWAERISVLLADRGATRVMVPPGMTLPDGLVAVPYDQPVEELKAVLVQGVEAGITWAKAAIADTGTLVLWPDADEPRLLSLLPPIHVVLLRLGSLVDNLAQVMAEQTWAAGMPTNALLISGPSKTADIEQTLAYGVHGPKELIVLVLTDA